MTPNGHSLDTWSSQPPESAATYASAPPIGADVKLRLPSSCDPPNEYDAPKQAVWIVRGIPR